MNGNYKETLVRTMRCNGCGSENISVDFDYGAHYCKSCGMILNEPVFAHS
jgi:transcription initiation factor TFIIIB Brf1 subunit/transcription initiation factor TFIIB